MITYTITLLFVFLCGYSSAQGLRFDGNDTPIEQRASYAVFGKAPEVKNELSIHFNLTIQDLSNSGYVYRLTDALHGLAYNFTYTYLDDVSSLLKFNEEGKGTVVYMKLDKSLLREREGVRMGFVFNISKQTLMATVNGKEYYVDRLYLPSGLYPSISFGCDNYNIDIASFTLRNLSVKCDDRLHQFPLNESHGEDVHDISGEVIGKVINPKWMINDAYHWRHRYTFHSNAVTGACFDTIGQHVYFFNRDSIVSFNLQSYAVQTNTYANEQAVDMRLGTNFFDGRNNKLYVYEVNDLPIGSTTLAVLDLQTYEWTPVSTAFLPMQLHHHAGYWNNETNRYIIFGGFGNQLYNRNFLEFDLAKGQWDTLRYTGDSIIPRYFTSMVFRDNHLFVFGGMGNETGDHTIGRKYYYDLYDLDLSTLQVKKLWDIRWDGEKVVPTRSMVMLTDSAFYALCYPEHVSGSFLKLYRFSIDDGSYQVLGDSIPILSDRIRTNANLYYNPKLNELYCVVQVIEENGETKSMLYSLSCAPVALSELQLYSKGSLGYLWLLGGVLLVMGVIFTIYYLINSKNRNKNRKAERAPERETLADIDFHYAAEEDKPNSIYLFGKLSVYDRSGKDITYMLSTRLKHAFVLILQHSFKNDGISSQKLTETLWPDRDDPSLKNLRGVTLSQLRKILTDMDGVELLYRQGVFKLELAEGCYCDLAAFHSACTSSIVEKDTKTILSLLSRGGFLQSSSDDPFYKEFADYVTSLVLSILPLMIESIFKQDRLIETVQLCEALFITDPLNELALQYLLRALGRLQLIDEAQRRYTLFASDYKTQHKQDYPLSFLSIR